MTELVRELERELVAEPVVGWRAWWAADWTCDALRRMGAKLHSIGVPGGWSPGVNEAVCVEQWAVPFCVLSLLGLAHEPPSPVCGCGFWAFRDRATLERRLGPYWAERDDGCRLVLGRVEMWGRIVETEFGWRAQFARPVELSVVGRDDAAALVAGRLAKIYSVPATVERLPSRVRLGGWKARAARLCGRLRWPFVAFAWCTGATALSAAGLVEHHGDGWGWFALTVNLACAVFWWRKV